MGTTWSEAASSWSSWRGWFGTGECVFFLVHPLTQMIMAALEETGTGPSSCVSLRMLLEEFPVLCARAARTWNLVHHLRCPCTWQSLFGASGCFFSIRKLDLRETTVFVGCNIWFDIGHMFCDSTLVAMDEFHTFSALRQTRILKCCSPFFCRTENRAQSMLPVSVFALRSSHLENWKHFHELHVAEIRD